MFSKFIRLFGKQVTLADLLALGAFAVGAVVTVLDLIGLWDKLALKPVEVVILLLLTTLILYSIQEKWEIARRNEELQQVVQSYGTVAIKTGEDELFDSAIEQIRTNKGYDVVKIYAPVGLWQPSNAKNKWFDALSKAIDPAKQTVTELRAVFGLPPNIDAFDKVAVSELEPFKERDAARLRYLPPASKVFRDLPGTGIVIFGDESIGFGFAVHGHHTVVDSTIFIQNKQIVKEVALWFDEVWEVAKDFQLKESRRGISLESGLKKAKEVYQQGSEKPGESPKA